ncbi:MAG: hypothetical protein OIF50_06645 [Flavobacteriaceae bacterium]|nr:hypothetical protein [Flavobacteriaceae bacterium]
MKNIFYLLIAVAITFTSCSPMDDIHEELATDNDKISVNTEYQLTDDDYESLGLSYGNFSSEDDAKSMLPAFLNEKFPIWGEGSLVNVMYKLYAPKKDEKSLIRYTVSTEDYDANPETAQYDNFSNSGHITTFLNTKYPDAAERTLVSLTYKYFSGTVSTLNNGFLKLNGEWMTVQGFTEEEYNAMGEGYANFSNEDEAEAKIPVFLKDKFKYDSKEAGDIEAIMYKLYVTDVDDIDGDGSTEDKTVYSYVKYFLFDGMNWSVYSNVVDADLKFGNEANTWVPDNTIRYVLTGADYASVGNGTYNNFDVRGGKAEESVEARLAKINTILKANFPSAVEGQKFVVEYNIYNGSAGVWEMKVILSGSDYILQD